MEVNPENINRLMKVKNWTTLDVAKSQGVSDRTVKRWLKGGTIRPAPKAALGRMMERSLKDVP